VKKNKLILLTILIILVLYCGAVIFVTKPSSFAYNALFGKLDSKVTTTPVQQSSTTQTTVAAPAAQIDTEALKAEVQAAAEKAAREIVEAAVKDMRESIIKSTDGLADEVAVKVMQELSEREGEFADRLYVKYGDELVEMVTQNVLSAIKAQEEDIPVVITPAQYETQRQAIRDKEIADLLGQLSEE